VTLDIRQLILENETLHIVGPDASGGMMAPLTSSLVEEIAYQARMLPATMPGRAARPAADDGLDEIGVAVNLPLTAMVGGLGRSRDRLHMAGQSLSQLIERWGEAGAGTLRGNVGTLLLYGGGKDARELEQISVLCSERYREIVGGPGEDFDGDGKKWDKVRVLTPAQLSNMAPGVAAVFKRNLGGVVIGEPPTVLDLGVEKRALTDAPRELVGEVMSDVTEDARLVLVPAPRPEAVVLDPSDQPCGTARRLVGRVDRLVTEVGTIGRELAQVKAAIKVLLEGGAGGEDGTEGEAKRKRQPEWIGCRDQPIALAILTETAEWVDGFGVPLGVPVKPCWPWHPTAVVVLLAAAQHHADVYRGKPAAPVTEYLTRVLPTVSVQVRKILAETECNAHTHRVPGDPAQYAAHPDQLPDLAVWWATSDRAGLAPGLTRRLESAV
jgi:hypothetical protein